MQDGELRSITNVYDGSATIQVERVGTVVQIRDGNTVECGRDAAVDLAIAILDEHTDDAPDMREAIHRMRRWANDTEHDLNTEAGGTTPPGR